jgi:hypothetical protein
MVDIMKILLEKLEKLEQLEKAADEAEAKYTDKTCGAFTALSTLGKRRRLPGFDSPACLYPEGNFIF